MIKWEFTSVALEQGFHSDYLRSKPEGLRFISPAKPEGLSSISPAKPEGLSSISPGQRPGFKNAPSPYALKGHKIV